MFKAKIQTVFEDLLFFSVLHHYKFHTLGFWVWDYWKKRGI